MARVLQGQERKDIDQALRNNKAERVDESPEVKGASYTVYRVDGRLYAVLYIGGWQDEISEITDDELSKYL
jgi:hypothetical protein